MNNCLVVLVQEDSKHYQNLITKLEPFKNTEGQLDMSVWQNLSDPTSTADISDVINDIRGCWLMLEGILTVLFFCWKEYLYMQTDVRKIST